MSVSLILPCYNPPQEWEKNVHARYTAFCSRIDEQAELIVVIDGVSPGVTKQHLASMADDIPRLKIVQYATNHGKGYAIRQGVAVATGEIIIYTDIDFPYTIESMYTVYKSMQDGKADLAVGVKDSDYYTHVPFLRRIISRQLRFMTRLFLSLPVTDTQCGLKGFRSNVKPLFLKTTIDRYLFDLEFIRNCYKSRKYKIVTIPVTLNEQVHFRKMNYGILLPEMLNFVRLLFKRNYE
jgi:glycosyltransferase involved in cell wall biosynthesis